jgi:RNA polymerase sigma-70 factor (ECF subfamily)
MADLDDKLMLAVGRGDKDAMAALARRHRERVERFAFRVLGDLEAAEDVAQETLIRLWRSAGSYSGDGRFLPYLYKVARSRCAERARGLGIEDATPDLDPPTPVAADPTDGADVGRALARLPRAGREVLVLSVCEGLTYAEIAEVLGLPKGTVASRKAAALRMLRDRLSGGPEREADRDGLH